MALSLSNVSGFPLKQEVVDNEKNPGEEGLR
jgi:hypothetical protein